MQFSSTQQSIAILLSGTLKSVLPTLIVLYFHEIFAVKNKVENELTKFLFRKVENLVISGWNISLSTLSDVLLPELQVNSTRL